MSGKYLYFVMIGLSFLTGCTGGQDKTASQPEAPEAELSVESFPLNSLIMITDKGEFLVISPDDLRTGDGDEITVSVYNILNNELNDRQVNIRVVETQAGPSTLEIQAVNTIRETGRVSLRHYIENQEFENCNTSGTGVSFQPASVNHQLDEILYLGKDDPAAPVIIGAVDFSEIEKIDSN